MQDQLKAHLEFFKELGVDGVASGSGADARGRQV
jgi:hypothetical protein